MQRFAVILFALVALFAVVVPSSASIHSQVKRETNSDRFARGLPPLPPSRRETAKRTHNSQVSVPYALNIVATYYGIPVRLTIPYLAKRAVSRYVIMTMATLSATYRTDRLARTYLASCLADWTHSMLFSSAMASTWATILSAVTLLCFTTRSRAVSSVL